MLARLSRAGLVDDHRHLNFIEGRSIDIGDNYVPCVLHQIVMIVLLSDHILLVLLLSHHLHLLSLAAPSNP